jgi:hypothetical protein
MVQEYSDLVKGGGRVNKYTRISNWLKKSRKPFQHLTIRYTRTKINRYIVNQQK